MASGYVRAATEDDITYLAPRLRPADRDECIAALGGPPEVTLPGSLKGAVAAHAMVSNDGTPIGIFGVHPFPGLDHVGFVWLVASQSINRHSLTFLRESRTWVEKLHDIRPTLINFTDARNTLHHRWLRWCGFTLLSRVERFGPGQLPFIEFAKVRP